MGPVGALIWKGLGVEPLGARQILLLSIPNYLCAAMAPVVSHIITRLGREVREAREMGSYLLGDLIARGGMGEVWQATNRFLVRPAAIKLIKPDVLGAAIRIMPTFWYSGSGARPGPRPPCRIPGWPASTTTASWAGAPSS